MRGVPEQHHRTAGLPEGSTSYYFRTRQPLLHAVVERLAELDAAAVPPLPGGDLGTLADHAARLMQHWLTAGRDRHLARYELALEATRRPELRDALVRAGTGLRAMVAGVLAKAGVSEPQPRAYDLVAFLDGLLFDQVAGAGASELTTDHLRTTIRTLLAAVRRRPPEDPPRGRG